MKCILISKIETGVKIKLNSIGFLVSYKQTQECSSEANRNVLKKKSINSSKTRQKI